jgi:hypothetical protein
MFGNMLERRKEKDKKERKIDRESVYVCEKE